MDLAGNGGIGGSLDDVVWDGMLDRRNSMVGSFEMGTNFPLDDTESPASVAWIGPEADEMRMSPKNPELARVYKMKSRDRINSFDVSHQGSPTTRPMLTVRLRALSVLEARGAIDQVQKSTLKDALLANNDDKLNETLDRFCQVNDISAEMLMMEQQQQQHQPAQHHNNHHLHHQHHGSVTGRRRASSITGFGAGGRQRSGSLRGMNEELFADPNVVECLGADLENIMSLENLERRPHNLVGSSLIERAEASSHNQGSLDNSHSHGDRVGARGSIGAMSFSFDEPSFESHYNTSSNTASNAAAAGSAASSAFFFSQRRASTPREVSAAALSEAATFAASLLPGANFEVTPPHRSSVGTMAGRHVAEALLDDQFAFEDEEPSSASAAAAAAVSTAAAASIHHLHQQHNQHPTQMTQAMLAQAHSAAAAAAAVTNKRKLSISAPPSSVDMKRHIEPPLQQQMANAQIMAATAHQQQQQHLQQQHLQQQQQQQAATAHPYATLVKTEEGIIPTALPGHPLPPGYPHGVDHMGTMMNPANMNAAAAAAAAAAGGGLNPESMMMGGDMSQLNKSGTRNASLIVEIRELPPFDASQAGNAPPYDDLINYARTKGRGQAHHCVMCGREGRPPTSDDSALPPGIVIIPTQNKDVCKICDTVTWQHRMSLVYFKWCKGCKRFHNLNSFAGKLKASKCDASRARGRAGYMRRKDVPNSPNGDEDGPMFPTSLDGTELPPPPLDL